MDTYINMRIKIPHDIHAQLLRKQIELSRDTATSVSLADTAVTMIAEAFLWECQHKGKEEVEGTNEQRDVLRFRRTS